MHDGILSHRKESDPDTWDKMDATGDHYARSATHADNLMYRKSIKIMWMAYHFVLILF